MANTINMRIATQYDAAGVAALRRSLQEIQRMSERDVLNLTGLRAGTQEIRNARSAARELQAALQSATNPTLGTVNTTALSRELNRLNLDRIGNSLNAVGRSDAFSLITGQAMKANVELKETYNTLDNIGRTIGNTAKWTIASALITGIADSFRDSYVFVERLDKSLNNIRVVTGQSRAEMQSFAAEANKAAHDLGTNTLAITDAALTFYQQGLGKSEALNKAKITASVSNVTGKNTQQTADDLTSVWNGFQLRDGKETIAIVDALAKVAAETASDLGELSSAMSKVSSSAHTLGLDSNSLISQLATVISVTRQAPESVGTAFKTIYARMTDLKLGENVDGVKLGDVAEDMAKVGINILNQKGDLRELGGIIDEIAGKWQGWNTAQKRAAATTLAGTRQYNNLMALFENWDMYEESLKKAENASGTLAQQQEIFMDSQKAASERLKASFEALYTTIWNTDDITSFKNILAGTLEIVTQFFKTLGGGMGVLRGFSTLAGNVFSKQISTGIGKWLTNRRIVREQEEKITASNTTAQRVIDNPSSPMDVRRAAERTLQINRMRNHLSSEEIAYLNQLKEEEVQLNKNVIAEENARQAAINRYRDIVGRRIELNTPSDYEQYRQNIRPGEFFPNQREIGLGQSLLNGNGRTTFHSRIDQLGEVEEGQILSLRRQVADARRSRRSRIDTANLLNEFYNNNSANSRISAVTGGFNALREDAQNAIQSGLLTERAVGQIERALNRVNRLYANFDNFDIGAMLGFGVNRDGSPVTNSRVEALEQLITTMNEVGSRATSTSSRRFEEYNADRVRREDAERKLRELEKLSEKTAKENGDKQLGINEEFREYSQKTIEITTADRIVATANAFTTLNFAVTAFGGIIDTVADENASFADKLGAIATTGGMMVPMFLQLGQSLNVLVPGLAAATGMMGKFNLMMASGAGRLALLAAGIGIAIGLYMAISSAIEKSHQAAVAANQAQIDALDQEIESYRNINELKAKYQEQLNVYKTTGEGKEQLASITNQLADALGVEINQLDLLSEKYDKVNAKIQESARIKELENVQNLKDKRIALEEKADLNATKGGRLGFGAGILYEKADKRATDILYQNLDKKSIQYTDFGGEMLIDEIKSFEELKNIFETVKQAKKEMEKTLSSSDKRDSEVYKNISKWISDNYKTFEDYANLSKDLQKSLIQLQNNSFKTQTTVDSLDSFSKVADDYKKRLEESFKSNGAQYKKEDLDNAAASYMQKYNTKDHNYSAQYSGVQDVKNALGDGAAVQSFLKGLTEQQLTLLAKIKIDGNDTFETIQADLDKLSREENLKIKIQNIELLDSGIEQLMKNGSLDKMGQKEKAGFDAMLGSLKTADGENAQEVWSKNENSSLMEKIKFLDDLKISQAQYREELQATQQTEIEGQLNARQIEQERRLAHIQRLQDAIAESEAKKLAPDQQILDGLNTEQAVAELAKLKEESISAQTGIEDLRKQLSESNPNLEINMSGIDTIEAQGEKILHTIDNITKATELIGEGFKVAAKDADTLAAVYPELMDNAQVLADGTVQLNQQTVSAILTGQQDILGGDTETTIAKIDNQITDLESAKEAAQAELAIAQKVKTGEIKLDSKQKEALAKNRETLFKYLVQKGLSEAKANAAVAAAMSGDMKQYAEITAKVADNTTKALGGALKSVADNSATNMAITVDNINNVVRGAHSAARAVSGIAGGVIMGSEVGARTRSGMISSGPSAATFNIDQYHLRTWDRKATLRHDLMEGLTEGVKYQNLGPEEYKFVTSALNFDMGPNTPGFVDYNVDGWISDLQSEIAGYTKGIARMTALKAKLRAKKSDFDKAAGRIKSGGAGKEPKGDKGGGKGKSPKGDKGGKGKEAQQKDLLEDESDLYHDIDIEINMLNDDLDELERNRKKLNGKLLLDSLKEEISLLEKSKELQKEKLEIALEEQKAMQEQLGAQGVRFAADGSIDNYLEALEAKREAANDVIKWFNSLSGEEQDKKENQKKLSVAEQSYKNFIKLIGDYDKLVTDKIPDIQKQIDTAFNKQIEAQIELFNLYIEVRLDLKQATKDWLEFKKNVIDDVKETDLLGNMKADLAQFLSYFDKEAGATIESLTGKIQDIRKEIDIMNSGKKSDIYGDNMAKAVEDLKKYNSEIMKQLQDMDKTAEQIKNSYIKALDEVNKKFGEQIKSYQFIESLIQHDMNMIKMINGEEAYSKLGSYYEQEAKNFRDQVQFQRQQVDFWKEEMKKAEKSGDEERFEKAKANWVEAVNTWNSAVESSIKNLKDKYTNSINDIFQRINNQISGGKGLAYLGEEWELINKNADMYLDKVNSMYAIDKLSDKYQKSIEDSSDVRVREQLNKLMSDELTMLKEKDKLTKYDIDRAELKYQIALKQFALENAQNSKTQTRLRRDSQGNYNYEFVADNDAINSAKQELEDLKNQLYNLDKAAYKDNLNQIFVIWQEFQNRMKEAAQINDPEQRQQRELLLTQQYGQMINALVSENAGLRLNLESSAMDELKALYDQNLANFSNMTIEQRGVLMGQLIPAWQSGLQQMADAFAGDGGFIGITQKAMEEIVVITNRYKQELEMLEESANQSFQAIIGGEDNLIGTARTLLNDNQALIDSQKEHLNATQAIIDKLMEMMKAYEDIKKKAIEASEAAWKQWKDEQRIKAEKEEAAKPKPKPAPPTPPPTPTPVTPTPNGPGGNGNSGPGAGGSGSTTPGSGNNLPEVGDIVTYLGGTYFYDSEGKRPTGRRGPGKKVRITYLNPGAAYPIHVESSDSAFGWLRKEQLKGFDTGGYTGDWGSSGRLALLHQKEIVLNKDDTSNFLSAVEILRGIMNSIGRNNFMKLNIGKVSAENTSGNMNIEQNVKIEANFPDVRSANEIEKALNNLINDTQQYVNKK